MYIYEKTEEILWTVGFYRPDGSFASENDYTTEQKAADRVHYLNGGDVRTAYKEDGYDG